MIELFLTAFNAESALNMRGATKRLSDCLTKFHGESKSERLLIFAKGLIKFSPFFW